MTNENQFALAPALNPGNSIVFLDGASGTVTATWSGTVEYEGPNGESTLRGEEIDRFAEVGQGHWVEQTNEQLKESERERTHHLEQYNERLQKNFLLAEEYLRSPKISPQIHRVLVGKKIQHIRSWVSTYSDELPDREQSEAIGTVSGNVLVTARAGSGKTATLVNRALFLIRKCQVSPDQILLLAFNKKAALEIRRRILAVIDPDADNRMTVKLQSKLSDNNARASKFDPVDLEASALDEVISKSNIDLPHAMTFHALAHRIVHPEEEILFDRKDGSQSQSRAVQQIIDGWLSDPEKYDGIRDVMLEHFRQDWDYIVQHGYDRDKESFLKYRRSIVNETLNGEYVKSYGEKIIADFLFEHDIPYKYERNFRWDEINYKPDFTIFPRSSGSNADQEIKQIVVEYFGLSGDPDYDEMSQEKRQFWDSRQDAAFLEYTPRDIASLGAERFLAKIKEDLTSFGVRCIPLSEDEIWKRARRRLIDSFTKAVRGFVSRCRKLALTVEELEALMASHSNQYETEQKFYETASGIYAAYLERLKATGEEDFDGLVLRAVEAIQGDQTIFYAKSGGGDLSVLEHISVDEFQDFSELFYRLLQAIRAKNPKLNLFCVGDDWQAINAFAGSDLKFFHDFESYFPESTRLSIATNYRSSSSIVDVGNSLMHGLGNPSRAHVDDVGMVELADIAEFSPSKSEKRRFHGDEITPATLRLVYHSIRAGKSVAILARRNGLPYYFVSRSKSNPNSLPAFEGSLKSAFSSEDRHKVDVSTTHSYKGLEKYKVIVIDAVDRSYPLIHPNWIFSRLFGDSLEEVVSAERRLFYVALTRAVRELVIITDSKRPSEFLTQLVKRAHIDSLRWHDYEPAPTQGAELHISLTNRSKAGGTFPIKDQIKACGYRWFSGNDSCWRKTISVASFDLSDIQNEPWCNAAVGVYVLIESDSDDIVAWYEVDHGRWKARKDDLSTIAKES